MAVTVNMLAEHFGEAAVCRPAKGDRRFLWPALIASLTLPKRRFSQEEGENGSCDVEFNEKLLAAVVDDEALYCGNERSAAEFLADHPSAFALAVGDGRFLNDMSPSVQSRLLLVDGVGSFAEVFEHVRLYMLRYNKWVMNMKQALLDGGGYQALLDCSKDLFEDFISITDSSFRLVASTGNPPENDEVARHLVEKGYHSKETIRLFRKYKAIKRWQLQTGIVRIDRTLIVNAPMLSYVFRMHGDYFVHMVLQSAHGLPSPALVDMFQILIDHVSLYVRHDWLQRHRYSNDAASFLYDLATRHPVSEERLYAQLEQHGMSLESDYRLAVLELDEEGSDGQLMLGYCAWRLAEMAPLAKVFIANERLLLLDDACAVGGEGESDDLGQLLYSFQQGFDCVAGVSDPFRRIVDLPYAFKQARLALEYGKRARPLLQEKAGCSSLRSGIYRFGDYFSAFIVEDGRHDASFVDFCLEHGIPWHIYQEDREKGTQDLDLLYCYLMRERRANEAAAVFHMHRNTLVYRMERLQKRFGFNLDDPAVRERMLFELNVLYGRKKQKGL